jgi:hypothetical protein
METIMKKLLSGLTALSLLSASVPVLAGPHDYRGERHFKRDRYERNFHKQQRHHYPRHQHHGHAPAWGALGRGLAVGGIMLAIETPRPPPVVVIPAPPPVVRAPERLWYYCDSARAYYPYVQQCYEGWRAVPTNP